MTLNQIISGSVQTATRAAQEAINSAPAGINSIFTGQESETRAFARAFQKDYTNSYAKLAVINASTNKTVYFQIQNNESNQYKGQAALEDAFIEYIIIQSILENYQERSAPFYSLSAPIILTAGSEPKIFKYTGVVLVNKLDGDQKARFYRAYERFLRATSSLAAKEPLLVELVYRDQIRRGYLTNLSTVSVSGAPNQIGIDFTMFVIQQISL